MKPWRLLVLGVALVLQGCLVSFKEPLPQAERAPVHLLGVWTRVDEWGDKLFLDLRRVGNNQYRALAYVNSPKNTQTREQYSFIVNHRGSRWYLSAGLPKSLGGNYVLAGFELNKHDELVIYNLDVDRLLQELEMGTLSGELVETPHGDGALISENWDKVFSYLDDPANADIFIEVARYERVTQADQE